MIPYHNDNPANVNVKADKNGNFVFVLVKDTSCCRVLAFVESYRLNVNFVMRCCHVDFQARVHVSSLFLFTFMYWACN